jgi:hypothetical protein
MPTATPEAVRYRSPDLVTLIEQYAATVKAGDPLPSETVRVEFIPAEPR